LLSPVYFTRTLSLFSTRYAHTLCFKQTGEIDNLVVSWEQSIWLCVCRFRVATGRRRVNKCHKRRPCWSAIKPVCITFSCLSLLSKIDIPWFLNWEKILLLYSSHLPLGVPNGLVINQASYLDVFFYQNLRPIFTVPAVQKIE
jgi:hypothetical protein